MKTKLIAVILCVLGLPLAAQELYPFQSPAYTKVLGYGSDGVSYICYAKSSVGFTQGGNPTRKATVAISAATNANPVVFTSTGHGLIIGSYPLVKISGGTGNWAAVNSTGSGVVATVIDANTFSIPVNSTSLSTLAGSVVFQTTAPRTTIAEWAVTRYLYNGSSQIVNQIWLGGHNQPLDQKCSDATSTTVAAQ